jgi:hypothetical protein
VFERGDSLADSTFTLKRGRDPSIEVGDLHPAKRTVNDWLNPESNSGHSNAHPDGTTSTIADRFQDYRCLAWPEYREEQVKIIFGCVKDTVVLVESDVGADDLAGKCMQQMTGTEIPNQHGLTRGDWLDLSTLLYESHFTYESSHPNGRNKVPAEELSEFHKKHPLGNVSLYGKYCLERPETIASNQPSQFDPSENSYDAYSVGTGDEPFKDNAQDQ